MDAPVKIALVGTGGIAARHAAAFRDFPDRVQLAAVCDIRAEAAKDFVQPFGDVPVFTDLATLLAETECEAVDFCTVHADHYDQTIAALEAGKHVLVEKPMAVAIAECEAMVNAAEERNRVLMVAQCQRYMPEYTAVHNVVASGALGKIQAVRFDSHQNIRAFVPESHWLLDGALAGGGILISVSVHRIDLMRYLVGDIARVYAQTRSSTDAFKIGAEDFAVGVLEFENGALGELFATYSGFRMPWGEMFMVFGERGTIHAVPDLGQYLGSAQLASDAAPNKIGEWDDQYKGFQPIAPAANAWPTDDGFVNEILHFAECIRTGKTPLSGGEDNLGTMRTVLALYESARRGEAVDVASITA